MWFGVTPESSFIITCFMLLCKHMFFLFRLFFILFLNLFFSTFSVLFYPSRQGLFSWSFQKKSGQSILNMSGSTCGGDAPFWSNSYFIASTGTTVMEKVKEYIEKQKTEEHKRKYVKSGRYKIPGSQAFMSHRMEFSCQSYDKMSSKKYFCNI